MLGLKEDLLAQYVLAFLRVMSVQIHAALYAYALRSLSAKPSPQPWSLYLSH